MVAIIREYGLSDIAMMQSLTRAMGVERVEASGAMYRAIHNDCVQMPPFESFKSAEAYYATRGHESVHWTRHPSRLDRDFGRKRFGDAGYAMEELVAELGAAFLCADLELTPQIRDDHAPYIAGWLQALKHDKRAIFTAASHAQKAVDFLHGKGSASEPDVSCQAAA